MDDNLDELKEVKETINEKIKVIIENSDSDKDIKQLKSLSEYLTQEEDESAKNNQNSSVFHRILDALESNVDIDPGRLLSLTDGIFGMVMTLMIFGISIPDFVSFYSNHFISSPISHNIGVTVVSFILVSSFWIYHHEFLKIKNLNIPYLWLNILFLICICFIPFTTTAVGNYYNIFYSEVVFGLNILSTIVVFILMYIYASKKRFFEYHPSIKEHKHVIKTLVLIMILTVVVNLLIFNVYSDFIYLFLLIPVISIIRDIKFRM